jgi:hypothetical protein
MLYFGRVGSSWGHRAFFSSSWGEKVITHNNNNNKKWLAMRGVAAPHLMQKSVTELGNIELKRVREIYLKVYDSIRMSCPLSILYRVGSLFGHV